MHAKFNFYFSVDKTQRSLTAATDAEIICRHDTSISLHTQVCQVCKDCMLTQYRHCSVVTEMKFLGIFYSILSSIV